METGREAGSRTDLGSSPTQTAAGVGLIAIVVGLFVLPASLTIDLGASIGGIASQLPTTLPAALMALAASGVNLLAGAAAIGLISRKPFESLTEVALSGFVGMVLIDLLLLYALGGIGFFVRPVLLLVFASLLALAWRRRGALVAFDPRLHMRLTVMVAFIGVVWSAPVLLQLASPVVPFMDVLPNHVAPVEHVRVFGFFDPLTTAPSPIYGPSRTSLGYVAVLGAVATVTGLPAPLAVSAFIAVEVILVMVAVHRLGWTLGGPSIAVWLLVTFALTQAFARLADDRARILALPLAIWTIAEFACATDSTAQRMTRRPINPVLIGSLAATFSMHAVIGTFTAASVLLLGLTGPRRYFGPAFVTVAVGAVLALPQAATMLGLRVPPLGALLVAPMAVAVALIVSSPGVHRAARAGAWVGIAGLMLVALWQAPGVWSATVMWVAEFGAANMTLVVASVIALMVARRHASASLIWVPFAVGTAAAITALALPPDSSSVLIRSIRFEVPKEVHTWAPIFLALAASAAIAKLTQTNHRPLRRHVALATVALFVVVSALPTRFEPIHALSVGEHRISENLAINLRHAANGFWQGYPDARAVVDDEQAAILDVLRQEIRAGRIDHSTHLLHVASSYQQWAGIPIGVFTGIQETTVSVDVDEDIHSVGGRLRPIGELERLLAGRFPPFTYLVLEREGLSGDPTATIVAAGYRSIFANDRGEVFARRTADSTSPGARPMTPGLEGGRVEVETQWISISQSRD